MPDKLIPGKKKTMAYSKPSSYKMKYQGNPSAFPFKSPLHNETLQSEQAKKDGASEATVQKLKNLEAGRRKRDELTNPVEIARVEEKLKELQPRKKA